MTIIQRDNGSISNLKGGFGSTTRPIRNHWIQGFGIKNWKRFGEKIQCWLWMLAAFGVHHPTSFRSPHHWCRSYQVEGPLSFWRGNPPSYSSVPCCCLDGDGHLFIQESLCSRYVASTLSFTPSIVSREVTASTVFHFVHSKQRDKFFRVWIIFEVRGWICCCHFWLLVGSDAQEVIRFLHC